MRSQILALVTLVTAALGGCMGSSSEPSPDVMVTFYPLQFLAERIGGDNVTVGTIVGAGTEPHDYEPTTTDVRRIIDARLVIIHGAGFEAWIERVREHAPTTDVAVATEGLVLRENPDAGERGELPNDPHTWLDPALYAQMAGTVELALSATFPLEAPAFRARAEELREDLAELDAEFAEGLASCEIRVIVTNHAAFGYLAARYDFEMIAITGLDPNEEPDARTLARVVDEAREHNVTIIFFEDLVSPRVLETVAREVGAETRVLSPLEGIQSADAARGADYLTVMRTNLASLREAMRCT